MSGTGKSLADLLPVLHELSRADKLRLMQFLVLELAQEEDIPVRLNSEYTIWSPYDAFGAAHALRDILKKDESGNDA
jgi:hypothetical protein